MGNIFAQYLLMLAHQETVSEFSSGWLSQFLQRAVEDDGGAGGWKGSSAGLGVRCRCWWGLNAGHESILWKCQQTAPIAVLTAPSEGGKANASASTPSCMRMSSKDQFTWDIVKRTRHLFRLRGSLSVGTWQEHERNLLFVKQAHLYPCSGSWHHAHPCP